MTTNLGVLGSGTPESRLVVDIELVRRTMDALLDSLAADRSLSAAATSSCANPILVTRVVTEWLET
jgi:hypothetical protein